MEGARIPPAQAGHGWLAAIVPADASRFRVSDPALAETLRFAGAELVDDAPDVDISPAAAVRGSDAGCAVVVIADVRPEGGLRPVRAFVRGVRSLRTRLRARRAARGLRSKGFPRVHAILWALDRPLRLPDVPPAPPPRLPVWALVVGRRKAGPTMLEAAAELAGVELQEAPTVRQGVVVAFVPQGVLRVAVGPAVRQVEEQRAVLQDLSEAVSPQLLGAGDAGLARWTLEQRLPGRRPAELTPALLDECVIYLNILFELGGPSSAWSLEERAAVVARAAPEHARSIEELAGEVGRSLAPVPRGYAHGDFWSENLLVEEGKLSGVVDWDYGGEGRLPVLDLFHLLVNEERRRRRVGIGRTIADYLLPGGADDGVREYCAVNDVDPQLLPDLAAAYWLDYVARQLELYADRAERPVWMEQNVSAVLAAALARPRSGA